ncbi:MAG TPA: hypothetical protein VJ732_11510 [Bryobacteraceae bacterium]|nr:hypothetical protein [Bryobacteraceae bacterium]
MALFTDGPPAGVEDLAAHDSQLLEVASGEGIDVARKISLAQQELELQLNQALHRLMGAEQPFWANPDPGVANVVITPPLTLWHIYRSLEMVYRDAYNSQLNDRYAGKRDEFHRLAKQSYEQLMESGVGMVWEPVPQAATPLVAAAPGALPDGTYYITMSWINAGGEEGASAVPAVIAISQSTIEVQPLAPPARAAGWNVYIGQAPESMVLQNAGAIAAAEVWRQPAMLASAGRLAGTGQAPNYWKPVPRLIQRG